MRYLRFFDASFRYLLIEEFKGKVILFIWNLKYKKIITDIAPNYN